MDTRGGFKEISSGSEKFLILRKRIILITKLTRINPKIAVII